MTMKATEMNELLYDNNTVKAIRVNETDNSYAICANIQRGIKSSIWSAQSSYFRIFNL